VSRRRGAGRRQEQGTAVLLVAVVVLVVTLMGLVALDAAVRFAAVREAADAATSAANDAVAAFEDDEYYATGATDRYRAADLASVVAAALDRTGLEPFELASSRTRIEQVAGRTVVLVDLVGRVPLPFAGALPGLADHADVEVTGRAVLREGTP
jgi:hypothetical protein